MLNVALILFCCWFTFIFFWFSPYTSLGQGKPWMPKELPKVKLRTRKPDVDLEQSLVVLGLRSQKFRLWELAAMAGTAFYEFSVTKDLLSTLLYGLLGRMLFRTYVALKAAHRQQMQDAQTLQFVRGIKDNLGIESNLLEAVRNAAQQLKEPMRGELILALNSTRGNRTLPEAIHEVGGRLHNPVYTLLSRIMEKGLKEGQREMKFAFEQVEKSLREGEKIANKRASKIRSYLKMLTCFVVFGLATPMIELLFRTDVWRETTYQTHWAWSLGAILDLYLASGLKKFTRLYVRRGGLMMR
ncbi:conserved membrane hypothetical protein [Candidatus Desulfosporosinus infrequens]|uniref:Type II secretion system protein GspF domain-containing protein n=1 Tax=Candidatus Desulfosporosinus infrequens TaxID=2043169 RepID=A0A2U3LUZ0_9FIRM|nr:conserved membrane hypothetical protein [Candidatus Desulfosporosinus infrequens]